ncbi:MAG: hypothetical protein KGZ96_14875 [Clostridia bacterium]|jgi:hypothetical protein|nr:hypothetical protein [Clostridia bacterium]
MLGELKREIISSDAIDLLVSFIKWSGLRCIIKKIEATFASYWNDSEFMLFNYENQHDQKRLKVALSKKNQADCNDHYLNFDIQLYHYQKEIFPLLITWISSILKGYKWVNLCLKKCISLTAIVREI